MTVKRKLTVTELEDARQVIALPKSEAEALGRLIHSLRMQVETLEQVAKLSGIDTWVYTDRVTTLADEIMQVKKDD